MRAREFKFRPRTSRPFSRRARDPGGRGINYVVNEIARKVLCSERGC